MSRAHASMDAHIDVSNPGIRTDLRQQAQPKSQEKDQESTDGSTPLFNKYLKIAEDEDKKMTDSWKADADSVLVFTGLFSASVAVLLAVSIGDLRPSSQDTSAFYLQNIYQLLSDPNRSDPTILSTPSIPPAFSPPNYAVWVNSLWFLSLVISLTCGFQATLLQQWARRYMRITQPPASDYTPQQRARIRAFFSEGVKNLHVPWVIETLPTLLHLSLFLFFSGLIIYLFNINHTVFTVVAWWVGLCAATYVGVTLMPLFRYDSPYYAPLSSSAWYLVNGVLFVTFKSLDSLVLRLFSRCLLSDLAREFRTRFRYGITTAAESAADNRSTEADYSAIIRVLGFSDEDLYLEETIALLPGFFQSKVAEDTRNLFKDGLVSGGLLEWTHQTLSSTTLSDKVKQRRVALCRKIMTTASLPVTDYPLRYGLSEWEEFFDSIDSALFLKAATYDDHDARYNSNCAISIILARVKKRDSILDSIWYELATGHLDVSESVLRDYVAYGDSALLANLNSFIRRTIDFYKGDEKGVNYLPYHMTKTIKQVTKLDVQSTLPELQHEFCTLWNKLVLMSRAEPPGIDGPNEILTGIRHIYIASHLSNASTLPTAFSVPARDEDGFSYLLEPPSYPLCTVTDHHPGSTSHVHGDLAGTTDLLARTSPTMLGGGKILDSDTPDVDTLSSPTPSPYPANLSPANKHPLDDIPAVPRRSVASMLAPPVPAAYSSPVCDESHHSPIDPFDSTTTLVIRNGIYTDTIEHTVNSHSRTSLLSTTSTPMLPISSISHSNSTDSLQHDEESTADPLSTFSYPPSSSIPLFTNNASSASAFSSLPASARDHIPAIHVTADSNTTSRGTTVRSDEQGK